MWAGGCLDRVEVTAEEALEENNERVFHFFFPDCRQGPEVWLHVCPADDRVVLASFVVLERAELPVRHLEMMRYPPTNPGVAHDSNGRADVGTDDFRDAAKGQGGRPGERLGEWGWDRPMPGAAGDEGSRIEVNTSEMTGTRDHGEPDEVRSLQSGLPMMAWTGRGMMAMTDAKMVSQGVHRK